MPWHSGFQDRSCERAYSSRSYARRPGVDRGTAVRRLVLQGARQHAQAGSYARSCRSAARGVQRAPAALDRLGPYPDPDISAMRDGRAVGRGQVRTLVQRELAAALGDWDLLLSPAAPATAFRVGQARRPRQV